MRGHLHPLRKRHLSVRNPERKNAKQILKISSVLLSRDRSVLSWWHEEKKMEAATHSTSHSLRSARLSVCLSSASFSLSLSLSLSPSLSPLQIQSAHLFFPPRILCLDPSSAPQLDREPWEFSPTWRTQKKKKKLFCSCWSSSGVKVQKRTAVITRMWWMSLSSNQKGVYIL